MIVVSNSSPLITLARVGHLDLLRQLFGHLHIAAEVHQEVVVRGAGRAAAAAVEQAPWLERHQAAGSAAIGALRAQHPLGAGELATVLLATTLHAHLAIMDDRAARRLAQARGISVIGCLGILETGHRKGLVGDLREAYRQLLEQGMHIDRQLLNDSLKTFCLAPL